MNLSSIKSVWDKYKKNIFVLYSIIFIVLLIIGLLPLEIKNKKVLFGGLFIDGYNHDGLKQHLFFMRDYVSKIKSWLLFKEALNTYRFDLGLGSDFFISYGYYSLFDPLTIIAYFIPLKHIEFSYYLLIMIRLYLSGIFIILLAQKFDIKTNKALLALSIFYVFSHTVVYSAFRHPMFINGPMLIPLIILGAEKVIRNERPYLLILSATYALMAQFYFFVFLAFGFELFVLLRIIKYEKSKQFTTLITVNLYFLLGSLLAGLVLVPQIYAVVFGGRAQTKGFVWYGVREYFLYGTSYLIPITGDRYSSSIGNFFVFFLCLLYLTGENEKKWYSSYLIILSVLFGISFFGYAINAFSYVNNRWTFLMIVPAALMIGEVIDGKVIIAEEGFKKSFKIFLLFLTSVISLGLIYLINISTSKIYIRILLHLIVSISALITFRLTLKKDFIFLGKLIEKLSINVMLKGVLVSSLMTLIIISIYYCYYLTPAYSFNKYYSDENTYEVINRDNSFFRVEQNQFEAGNDRYSNDNVFYKFNSTSEYNTMNNRYINEFFNSLNIVNNNNTVGYNGFNRRARLLVLNNVKYYIIRESEKTPVPYGFEYFDSVWVKKYDKTKKPTSRTTNIMFENNQLVLEKANIYINKHFVNFGTMYYNYIGLEEFENLHPLEKESVLLDSLVISKQLFLPFRDTQEYLLEPFKVKNYTLHNIKIEDNRISVDSGGGQLRFFINDITNSEVYLEIKGIKHLDKYKGFTINYQTTDILVSEVNYPYGRNMYCENPDHLINLGYYQSQSQLEVIVDFEKGEYYFDEINYYLLESSDIKANVENLNKNTLTQLELKSNGFSGMINSHQDGFLYISLPYSDGFNAFVDGSEVEIHKANIGYMAIEVPQGSHHIEFIYQTPGIKLGLLVSLISLLIIIILLIIDIIKFVKRSRLDVVKYNMHKK